MNEQEEFLNILNYFVEKYHLTIKHPYCDGYVFISQGDNFLGGMNYEGFNLLYNLTQLTGILEPLLR